MKYSEFKPLFKKVVHKDETVKRVVRDSNIYVEVTLYALNGDKQRILYNRETEEISKITTLDFLNQRLDIDHKPYYMEFDRNTHTLKEISYADEIENLPSKITWWSNGQYKEIAFRTKGQLHRTDGPAKIFYDSNGNITGKYYYYKGKEIKDEFKLSIIQGQENLDVDWKSMRDNL